MRRGRLGSNSSLPKKKRQHASSPKPTGKDHISKDHPEISQKYTHGNEGIESIRRARTFPTNADLSHQKRGSVHYDANILSSFDPTYNQKSGGTYTPSNSEPVSARTPDSVSSSGVPFNATTTQQTLGYPQGLGVSGLPDFSAMMFPSGDPFAYPNQPMITLEDGNFMKQETSAFDSSTGHTGNPYNLPQSNTISSNTPFDNLEAQVFESLPPYLMQGQSQGVGRQNLEAQMGIQSPEGNEPSIMAMNGGGMGGWSGQQLGGRVTPGMNLDEIFGDEWKRGWTNQGTRF